MKLYQDIGSPLTEEQITILTNGSDSPVVINKENQHFLLNLFWALGLANQNKILTEGSMMRNGKENVVNFASTGGWTLAAKPVSEVYASQPIVLLTDEQQKRRWKKLLWAYIDRAATIPPSSRTATMGWRC